MEDMNYSFTKSPKLYIFAWKSFLQSTFKKKMDKDVGTAVPKHS